VVRQRTPGSGVLQSAQEPPLRSGVVAVAGRLRFQIDMMVPPPVDTVNFVQMLVSVLCSELANRQLAVVRAGQALAQVPQWLVAGQVNRLCGLPREATLRVVRGAVAGNAAPSFASVTGAAGPAAGQEALYRAMCELLVDTLEGQPDGRTKLRKFLMGLKPGEPWQVSFREAFGDWISAPATVERWWAIVVSRAAGMIVPQALTHAETRQKLNEALEADEPELAGGLASGTLPRPFARRYVRETKKLTELLIPVELRLLALSPLAHPLYRPAISSYLEGIGWVRKKSLRQFEACLRRAVAERRRADEDAEAIGRYLGSVEASLYPEDFADRFSKWFQTQGGGASRPATPAPMRQSLDRVEPERAR
jgi:hypothetical protein